MLRGKTRNAILAWRRCITLWKTLKTLCQVVTRRQDSKWQSCKRQGCLSFPFISKTVCATETLKMQKIYTVNNSINPPGFVIGWRWLKLKRIFALFARSRFLLPVNVRLMLTNSFGAIFRFTASESLQISTCILQLLWFLCTTTPYLSFSQGISGWFLLTWHLELWSHKRRNNTNSSLLLLCVSLDSPWWERFGFIYKCCMGYRFSSE